ANWRPSIPFVTSTPPSMLDRRLAALCDHRRKRRMYCIAEQSCRSCAPLPSG
ncbi:MAG: hypothetical protein AVDCRST_MAG93-2399, partial [uncultured Chloroflexia bacterium]